MNYIEDLKVHVSSDPRAKEEDTRLSDAKDEKSRKIRKLAPFVVPVLVVVLLLISTVPSFVAKRDDYNDAVKLMKSGRYEEARTAFEALGSYSDSENMAKYEVEYLKTLSYVSDADAMFESNGAKSAEMYENAIDMFSSLDGYADSNEQINLLKDKITRYDETVRKDAYAEATNLLKEGKYVSAKSAFEALGRYSDCQEMAQKCIYDRAKKLYDYISKNEVRNVYANPTFDGEDYDIEQTKYPVLDMRPICVVAAEEFLKVKDYKDSQDLAAFCEDKGNFKKEFLDYCRNGQAAEAIDWLNKYDDVFDEREKYSAYLSAFGRYATAWELYKGDLTLLPLSGGCSDRCTDIEGILSIEDGICYLTLKGTDAAFEVKMVLADNGNGFIYSPGDGTNYFAVINQNNHLAYSRYSETGATISSCEYNLP